MKTLNELINNVQELLNKEELYGDVYQFRTLPSLVIDINWGDWKHEHLRCNYLVEKYLKENNINYYYIGEELTEEDGSDCYSAMHKYIISGLEY